MPRPPNHRRIPDDERQRIVDVLHSDEFIDQPPHEVYAALLVLVPLLAGWGVGRRRAKPL